MWKVAVVAALVAGCGMQIDPDKVCTPPAGSDIAIRVVADFYGIDVPVVFWYGGHALTCVDTSRSWCSQPGQCWESDNGAGCTAGEAEDGVALVAAWPGVAIHDTPMAHELGHLKWGDPNHVGAWFQPGGELDQATALLASMGL